MATRGPPASRLGRIDATHSAGAQESRESKTLRDHRTDQRIGDHWIGAKFRLHS